MLSVVLIVKNEEVYIQRCLESLKDFDEIIVVDTGSEDNTKEKVKNFTDKIYDFQWNDNFAEARNFAKSKATGDYILSIDADEILLTPYTEIVKQLDEHNTYGITLEATNSKHKAVRLFKNIKEIFWVGAIHECLCIPAEKNIDVTIHYDYSPAHQLDPERTVRILEKELAKKPNLVREKYYYAREFWYKKDYEQAIKWFWKYLNCAVWLPEISDAYLYLARCYWLTNQGDIARRCCNLAIGINPNFKEALLFMAEISWEDEAKVWRKLVEIATNEKALFRR